MENDIDLIKDLAETKATCKSNSDRIVELSKQYETLHSIATSVEVLANKVTSLAQDMAEVKASVNEIEAKPIKRYDGIVDKIILTTITAVVTWILRGVLV